MDKNFNVNFCKLESASLAYKLLGTGDKTVVIEHCLSSCSAEWWPLAEKLASDYRVLLYDRAGYGQSSKSKLSRTPENIAGELHGLLGKLGIVENIIIKETMEYGGLSEEEASKVDAIWERIIRNYLTFSNKSKFVKASKSGHFVHLTEFNLVEEALKEIQKSCS